MPPANPSNLKRSKRIPWHRRYNLPPNSPPIDNPLLRNINKIKSKHNIFKTEFLETNIETNEYNWIINNIKIYILFPNLFTYWRINFDD